MRYMGAKGACSRAECDEEVGFGIVACPDLLHDSSTVGRSGTHRIRAVLVQAWV